LRLARDWLSYFKFIWIGRPGVMARQFDDSRIFFLRNERDVADVASRTRIEELKIVNKI
jgi:hypothetical protein